MKSWRFCARTDHICDMKDRSNFIFGLKIWNQAVDLVDLRTCYDNTLDFKHIQFFYVLHTV